MEWDYFVDWAYDVVWLALQVLPDSPFQSLDFDISYNFPMIGNVMSFVNYFVPINDFFVIAVLYIGACATYMGVRYALRMGRFIS